MAQPLISSGLISKLRKVANRGLQTSVTLLTKLPITEGDYGDDVEAWVTLEDTVGWMRMMNTPVLTDLGGVEGSIGVYRLHIDANIDLDVGDMVIAGNNEYVVQDTNLEDTYRLFTTATMRRRQ